MVVRFAFIILSLVFISGCKPDEPDDNNNNDWVYNPEPVQFHAPQYFPAPRDFSSNPLTKQGIKLGKHLFYDSILSDDSTQSCATCHQQNFSFVDANNKFSTGIDGIQGNRNSMPVYNLAWGSSFFWDGRAATIEEQALQPVENPIEMHEDWPDAVRKLTAHNDYPKLFYEAFGIEAITKEHAAKAMAQFMRTMVSSNSRYDKNKRGELFGTGQEFTDEEDRGFELFMSNATATGDGADCFHCHGSELFADVSPNGQFRNNGLTEAVTINDFPDAGRGTVTGNPNDYGKFKVPSLRNISLTPPYMHDGRFQTLDEVIEFYNSGVKPSPTVDPQMIHPGFSGLNLSPSDKAALKAFLLTLTDEEFINNTEFSKP
jgi:cytochrome c peroxidase